MNDEITAVPEAEKPSRFSDLFGAITQDLWLKAVALALALAFWGSIQLSTDVDEQLLLRVSFTAPEGQMVVGEKIFRVQASVIGSLAAMEQYQRRRDGDVVYIPTDSFGLGSSTIYLNRDLLGLPKALRVEAIRPSVVRVKVARRISKQVPIRAQITGTPSAGLKVKRWEVIPDQVTVDGPEQEVGALKEVIAGPVSVEKEVSNMTRMARLRTGVLGVQVVDLHEAEVRVEIAAPLLDRSINGVSVVIKSEQFDVQPKSVDLRLKGPLDTLNRLEAADLQAVVVREDLVEANAGDRLPVRLEGLPQGVVRLGPVPMVQLFKRKPKTDQKEKP
jgi:hypothetical protein